MPTAPSAATAASKSEAANTFFADLAKQTTEQFIGAVRQTTKLGLDTASAWIDTLTAVLPEAPAVPFAPSKADVQQWVSTGFETAESVLALQREIASEIVTKLLPAGK
jgi:hypothetical protein